MSLCRHCHRNKASNSGRGLCRACWNDAAIRFQYPLQFKKLKTWDDPTDAELDALITEQRKCLPAWWDEETARAKSLEFHHHDNSD